MGENCRGQEEDKMGEIYAYGGASGPEELVFCLRVRREYRKLCHKGELIRVTLGVC